MKKGKYYCFGKKATLVGTEGPDEIKLTPGEDVVVALGGDDAVDYVIDWGDHDTEDDPAYVDPTVPRRWWSSDYWSESDPSPDQGSSHDFVCAGPGNDGIDGATKVDAGPGNDWVAHGRKVYGGDGDDRVSTWDCQPTVVYAGKGNDTVITGYSGYAEEGNGGDGDLAHDNCPSDQDIIYGGAGDDGLSGGDGNDDIYGGPGDDLLLGDLGNNRLYGWAGNDIIRGDTGDDLIDGGGGKRDACGGGHGTNTVKKCERETFGSDDEHAHYRRWERI
jgi:Ca2+-binding RTX toxin-like protein